MHPYHFVAILGSNSEGDWAVLTGRNDGPVKRGASQNDHQRLSPAHRLGTVKGKARQKNRRKEGSNEKGRDYNRSSYGSSNLGTWYPPVAEALILSEYFMKEGKQ